MPLTGEDQYVDAEAVVLGQSRVLVIGDETTELGRQGDYPLGGRRP
jgi:hypothetical protein